MAVSQLTEEGAFALKTEYPKDQIQQIIVPSLQQFHSIIQAYVRFNVIFWIFLFIELAYVFFHLAFLIQSFVLAVTLALCVATIFFYFTLKIYFQAKKSDRCLDLKDQFIEACKQAIHYRHGISEHHIMLAQACADFAAALHGKEYGFFPRPKWLAKFSPLLDKLSCWCHWDDVYAMRELLLLASVDEHIKLVKCQPTDLSSHVGLANAYVMLSGLYVDPRTIEGFDDDRWIPRHKYDEKTQDKFRSTSERAIEEFKILNDYAPSDPWVHAQLAYSYHDLQMPEKEIKEYETILQLCPDDKEILFKLGKLYFQQGRNADGLRVYEQLKRSNYKKAEGLIHYYGAYIPV